MVSNEDKWIRIFDIPDIGKHKKGFTIYKVISMLYPEKCPDAITKITVWKRYNDFKKLHREMKSLHHSLKIKDKFPSLPSASFFNRFDEEVIHHRKQMILVFLDYISAHSNLFTCNGFVKFFETSHTPCTMLSSKINNIRADLNLPSEPEYLSFHSPESEDECTMSDTDSISTMSSLSSFVQVNDNYNDPFIKTSASLSGLTKKLSSEMSLSTTKSSSSENELTISMMDMAEFYVQDLSRSSEYCHLKYLEEAEEYIAKASSLEGEKKYNEALTAYRHGIYLLLKYMKDEKDESKRKVIQFKVEKYLLNANKIYCLYLSSDKKAQQEFMTDPFENSFIAGYSQNIYNDKSGDCIGDFHFVDSTNESSKHAQYIAEAENYILLGGQLEVERKHIEAFSAYKQGIFKLLKNVKDDKDIDRKNIVRYKVEKYLLRTEKIFNLHLCKEDFNVETLEANLQRPISELYKYKVIKIIDSGMMVIHIETQQLYYIKVIYKEYMFMEDDLILPKKVPFMVQLHNFYVCENAVFLILEYCSGLKLWDYINSIQSGNTTKYFENAIETPSIFENSDNESECSFSELINDYNLQHNFMSSNNTATTDISKPEKSPETEIVETIDNSNVNEIVTKSQKLLDSVDAAIERNRSLVDLTDDKTDLNDFEIVSNVSLKRQMSDASDDYLEIEECNFIQKELVVKWAAQLLLALEKLHKNGVVCCDLQSKNILISEKGDLVLTYICRVNKRRIFNSSIGTIMAPEVYKFEKITSAADWWSYGVILYEMIVGVPLNFSHPEGILSYTMLRIPKFVSQQARSLLKQLLTYEHTLRLGSGMHGTEEIKSHPFFHGISWEDHASKVAL